MRLGELWNLIIQGNSGITEKAFIQSELESFMNSNKRREMIQAKEYYKGNHDIKKKVRSTVDELGQAFILQNLPNNIICDNRVDDLVDQKTNYLLSKPIEVQSDVDLDDVFNMSFMRKLKSVGRESIQCGIAYLVPYFDTQGKLQFKKLRSENVLPFWADEEHTELDAFLYWYDIELYSVAGVKNTLTKVEYYTPSGVKYFTYSHGQLSDDTSRLSQSHYINGNVPTNWHKIPLIPFKFNEYELPIIRRVKTLQDALNTLLSNFADNMEEDVRSTILVIKNYDGEDLSNFRQKLATYGAIKVRTEDGVAGGVETLNIEVNASNYELVLKLLRRSIIENGRGFDARDDRMSNNPNQMNIQSMYSDIDLDANDMESEFQASLELLMEFVGEAMSLNADARFVFNRDLPINQADIITNCKNSVGIISKETIIANHPWTLDTEEELKRLESETQELDYVGGEQWDTGKNEPND